MVETKINDAKPLRVSHVNIRSINNCFDEFVNFVEDKDFDLIALSETWLTSEFPSFLVSLPHYTIVRADRLTRGGGVCFYVRNNLKYKLIAMDYITNNQLEQLWITIKANKRRIAVGVIYKAPLTSISCFQELESVLSNICLEHESIILMGDTNVDFLKPYPQTNVLKSILESFNLKQIVNQPTRITDSSATLIDIICVSNDTTVNKCGTLDLLDMTDHRMVFCEIMDPVNKLPLKTITYRNFKYFDLTKFSQDAQSINWNEIVNIPDMSSKVNYLNDAIITLLNTHAPICTINVRRNKLPYITDTIKYMIQLKNKAYGKFLLSKSKNDYKYYKDLRNYVTLAIKNEKVAYFKYQLNIDKKNPKKLWQLFANNNVHVKPKNEISPELVDVNNINNFFLQSVNYPQVDINKINTFLESRYPPVEDEFIFHTVTPDEVLKCVYSLKSEAVGIDGINLKMLKYVLPFCLNIVTHILNVSLQEDHFPDLWKNSLVTPLPKVSVATELSELRPVSVLPTMSKVLELIVHSQLSEHIRKFNILPPIQSGFRQKHSTTTALMKISNDIARNIDNSEVTYLVLLDYSKAFDVINIELLVAKLHYYGCDLHTLNWFRSYLTGRNQQVIINGVVSNRLPVTHGVPQGSILGPLLFSIFTSDLPSILTPECCIHMYADDTQLYMSSALHSVDSTITKLNVNLSLVYQWSSENGLILNPKKSAALCIGTSAACAKESHYRHTDLKLWDCTIKIGGVAKNLGVTIDNTLSFEKHVNKKCSLCYFKLKSLYKFKYILPSDTKWNLVNSLVLSNLDYCSPVYYNFLSAALKNRLQVIQNCCLRFAYNINRRDHVTPFYISLGILKICGRFELQFSLMVFNVIKSKSPNYLYSLLIERSSVHDLQLRNTNLLTIPKHNTVKFEASFEYTASRIFNKYYSLFCDSSTHSLRNKIKDRLLINQQVS